MNPASIARLSTLFDEVVDLPASALEMRLAALAGEDAALVPALRRMLAGRAAPETADLLKRGPAFTAPADATAAAFEAGDAVGPWRLLHRLGEGGMGEVWLAERQDGQLRRPVALKLPMLGLRRGVLVQRFARERDILGALVHPHIARLYDAGVAEDGQPWLALEYVEGVPITEHVRARGPETRAVVRLALQVLEAVQHAHANLVVHRDLKPGNVLVTADGRAMLLDFGIAKLLQDERAEAGATELTRVGGHAMTPAYAAPEQLSGAPVSIATDVWALGVLLYELLAGERPFAGERQALERAILEADPKPPRGVPAELGTIVLKALKKAPVERYATVAAFGDDLQRWLDGRPVRAQPDSRWYRTRKFVARNRLPVAAASLAAAALLASSLVAWRQAEEARRQAESAERQATLARQEARRAQAVQGFLTDLFNASSSGQSDPQQAQRATARELLDRGTERVDEALADAPLSRIEVMRTLAGIYQELGLGTQATTLALRAVEVARKTYGARDAQLAGALLDAVAQLQEGPERERIPGLLDEAIGVLDAAGEGASALRGMALRQRAHYWRYVSLRRFIESADAAAEFVERRDPAAPTTPGTHLLAGRARMAAFDFDAALPRLQAALVAAGRLGPAAGARSVRPIGALASALEQQARYAEAEQHYRAALALGRYLDGDDHPETLIIKAQFANLLLVLGRDAEGDALQRAVRERLATQDPRLDPQMRSTLEGLLGRTLLARGRPDLALPLLSADIEDMRKTLPGSGGLALRELSMAEALAALGDSAGARRFIDSAEADWRRFTDGLSAPRVETSLAIGRAAVLLAGGAPADALALVAPDRASILLDRFRLLALRSQALRLTGRAAEALAAAESLQAELGAAPEGQRPVHLEALALQRQAEALHDLKAPGAELHVTRALALRRQHDLPGSLWLRQLEGLHGR